MASTIPLAKPYTPAKLVFPVALSRKVDGVPVKIYMDADGYRTETRQGKPMPSVAGLVDHFYWSYMRAELPVPVTLVGEVYQRGNMDADFKDTSGIVRRQYDQSDQLAIALFDTDTGMLDGGKYGAVWGRGNPFEYRLDFLLYLKQIKLHKWVTPVNQYTVNTVEELESYQDSFSVAFPKAEGLVARSYADEWAPGKRTWGYQKVVKDPMIDLRIVGFEEAVDKYGEPMGMVGGLVASYKGEFIGIGPGKLTHRERAQLLSKGGGTAVAGKLEFIPLYGPALMAQIKYKVDDSYDALRQPTFQCWRPDKEEPDA